MASFQVGHVLLWESMAMVLRDLKNRVLRCGIWWSPPLDNVGRYYCVDKSVGLLVLFICRSVILLWVDLLKIEFWDCNKFNCRIILSVQESRNESQVAASDTIPSTTLKLSRDYQHKKTRWWADETWRTAACVGAPSASYLPIPTQIILPCTLKDDAIVKRTVQAHSFLRRAFWLEANAAK